MPTAAAPEAVIYRGPASAPGCAEAVAAVLSSGSMPYRCRYIGPQGDRPLSAEALSSAAIYVQPGGGDDLAAAWRAMRPAAEFLRSWVRGGGVYVGFCMGGFLAGRNPGFGLLAGDSAEYIKSAGATIDDDGDHLVEIDWKGSSNPMYFQGGPDFVLGPKDAGGVLGHYPNGSIAAMVARFGAGALGVTGPHPEAPASWYRDAGLVPPNPLPFHCARELVAAARQLL